MTGSRIYGLEFSSPSKSSAWRTKAVLQNFDYFSVLLPTLTLVRLSAETIHTLTSERPDSSEKVAKTPRKVVRKKKKRPFKIKLNSKQVILKYKCQDCDEKFKMRLELMRHILKVHFEGEKFECECGKLHRHKSGFYACRSSHRTSGFACKVESIVNCSYKAYSFTKNVFFSHRSVNESSQLARRFLVIGSECIWKSTVVYKLITW